MPNPNAVVDFVNPFGGALEALAQGPGVSGRYLSVSFRSGQSGRLDLSNPRSSVWASVLDSMQQNNLPVYAEIEPATNEITNLLIPIVGPVEKVNAVGDDREVELRMSHARHFLRKSHPDFTQLLDTLERALSNKTSVAVTETADGHEIIDVRPVPSSSVPGVEAPPEPPAMGPSEAVSVTLEQAQQMFALVSPKICCPQVAASPCIPFNFPDDGCWGRAHEMSRLMIAAGITPNKVWIFGNLHTPTKNHPNCAVNWGWHVAPTLSVGTQTYVIDPSLFDTPVAEATWKGAQGDPGARLIPTSAQVFIRNESGSYSQTDTTYSQTNTVLANYRNQLRLRSVGASGPPPYANCMPKPPGVQYIGVIAGGATQRFFTFNWPAAWHVVWTVMPLTTCSGAPQLTWKTQVERAGATMTTYWLELTNLTPNATRFEWRYKILKQ